ncbi:MAG: hypothetical protein JWM47_1252, partial [Acidimicrobiales bacterium]|nr:hypothetical protein [Acidimicrobiales bacterium]
MARGGKGAGGVASAQEGGGVLDLTDIPVAGPEGAARRLGLLLRAAVVPPTTTETDICRSLCRLAVPGLADQASIYMLVGEELVRTGNASGDVELAAATEQRMAGTRLALGDRHPLTDAVRQAEPLLISRVPAAEMRALFDDQRWVEDILVLGVHSFFLLPLLVGRRVLGALSLAIVDAGRSFTVEGLERARDLA